MKNKDIKPKRKRKDFHPRFFLIAGAFGLETLLVIALVFLLFVDDFQEYFIWYLIAFIIIDIILALYITNSKVQIDYKVSWLAVILALPVVGGILYLLYAYKVTTKKLAKIENNKMSRFLRKQKELYIKDEVLDEINEVNPEFHTLASLNSNSNFPLYNNTNLKYYPMGEDAWEDILNCLKSAKEYIFMEFFIVEYGEFFDSIHEVLKEKAKEGVDIRFIYDDFGCATYLPKNFDKMLGKEGIKAFRFNKIKPTMNIRQNCRDHRKIIVVDGVKGFTGGCNLGDEYVNRHKRFGIWKDNFIYLEGEGIQNLITIFLSNYILCDPTNNEDFAKFSFESHKQYLENEIINKESFVQPISSMPYTEKYVLRNCFLKMINMAKKRIYLSTPYLIPDNELQTALINAAKSGIEVIIFTPGIPDKKMVYQATKSYYSMLLINGVKIYEYTPGFNHEKTMVIDDNLAITGTCNFDFRSFYLHFEESVVIYNDKEISKMIESFEEMKEVSSLQDVNKYLHVSFFRKIYWSILHLIAPLL